MAKPPVTRVQLDAYRFGQRRLESALALRDPVLLHEQIRTQRRLVAAGVVLAILVACGLMAYIHLSHKDSWVGKSIIMNNQSGQMYVVIHQPDRLVPVNNLAAARLVLKAASDPKSGLTGLVGNSDSSIAKPISITSEQMVGAPITATSAVYGAPGVNLPSDDSPTAPHLPWALCDNTANGRTTVLYGVGPTTALGLRDGVVVSYRQQNYLITGGKKFLIGPGGAAAYDLKDAMVNPPVIADNMFAAIPDGKVELRSLTLAFSSAGSSPSATELSVGDVVEVNRPGQAQSFYVLVPGGVAKVAEPVAKLLRAGRGADLSEPAPQMTVDQIDAYSRPYPHGVPGTEQYPAYTPTIRTGPEATVMCWQYDASGSNPQVTLAPALPVLPNQPVTTLAQADDTGPKLDQVSLPSGAPIDASSVAGANPNAPHGYWLVAPNGVAYPVADTTTAEALGLKTPVAAPADVLSALPTGPTLDLNDARKTVDVYRENPATGGGG
jgi:type VII secretion protein EccB